MYILYLYIYIARIGPCGRSITQRREPLIGPHGTWRGVDEEI
jgi:hypothetical protein